MIHLALIDSTQSFLARHPELGCCAALADAQTEGRGRGENRWESAPGAGLWLSVAIPQPVVPPGILLQRAMGAVAEVLEPCGVKLGLKWPNDLVAWQGDRLVKLGGIIGEQKGDMVLLGLGLNLRAAPLIPDRAIPPAALVDLGAHDIPEPVALAQAIQGAWQDLSVIRVPAFRWPDTGDAVAWEKGSGICEGWLEDGRLAVRTDSGLQELCVGDLRGLGMA